MNKWKAFNKSFTRQFDNKDCGVACLSTAIRYSGHYASLEYLRELSGTSDTGTSLLGIKQAANSVGFDAEAYYADSVTELSNCNDLMILHVLKYDSFEHFILIKKDDTKNGQFLVADPDDGVAKMSLEEIDSIWKSKALVILKLPSELNLPNQETQSKVLTWLKPLLFRHQNKLIIVAVLGIMSALLAFSTAIFTEKLVDNLLPTRDTGVLLKGVLVWAVLLSLAIILGYLHRIATIKFSLEFNTEVTQHFFSKILFLPKMFFRSKKTGDLVTRMEDIEDIERGVVSWAQSGFVNTFVVLFSVLILFTYDVELAGISTLFLPLLFIITLWLQKKIIASQRQAMISHGLSNANYVDVISGIDTIKSNNLEEPFSKRSIDFYYTFRSKVKDSQILGLKFSTLIQVVTFLSSITIIGLSSIKVLQSQLEIGNMFAIISISSIASSSTLSLVGVYLGFQESKIAFDRINELNTDRVQKPKQVTPGFLIGQAEKVEVKDLSFSYPGEGPLFNNLNLVFEKGKVTTLLGETGVGKTTLINLIQLLYTADTGVVLLNDCNLKTYPFEWRRSVGVVPQDVKVFNTSLWKNIYLKNMDVLTDDLTGKEDVSNFLQKNHQVFGFIDSLPQGLDTPLGEGGIKLSGGQKQLLGLARALIKNPKFLILDEPTASLDRKTEEIVLALINQLKYKMPIFLVTHNILAASKSDQIYLLENAEIVGRGTPDELLSFNNMYSQFWSTIS
uniref:peptidase domain-containing ABC transporter n=1 Tax=Roseivirga sp. TaxID=1964215 RepID=UPI00404838BF